MPYQVVTSITVVTDGDVGRIIGKPDTLLLIHINVIGVVSVHPVITAVISRYVGFTHVCIHIQFIYAFPTCGNQELMLVQSDNLVELYIIGRLAGDNSPFPSYVIYKYSLFIVSYNNCFETVW